MIGYGTTVACEARNVELHGATRFIHTWLPTSETPWASMTIVHGFGDHGGRFGGMGTSLAALGIALVAVDLVGHGRSPGRRGCINSYEQLLDEVQSAAAHTRTLCGNVPQFLFGQSMGGNLVLNLALRRPQACETFQGAIACSPMLRPGMMPREKFMDAGRWLAKRVPNLRIKAAVEVTKLSQDRRAQDAYLRDRYVHRAMSLRLAANLVDSGQWALDNAARLRLPTLVMHGSEDTLTSPEASQDFVNQVSQVASFKLWAGCRHELHDDLQREGFFAYLSDWMKRQCITAISLPSGTRWVA